MRPPPGSRGRVRARAISGLAVGLEGFVLNNAAMIIAGTVVGAAGTLLTQLMAKAMNRSIANILFGHFGVTDGAEGEENGFHGVTPVCGRAWIHQ